MGELKELDIIVLLGSVSGQGSDDKKLFKNKDAFSILSHISDDTDSDIKITEIIQKFGVTETKTGYFIGDARVTLLNDLSGFKDENGKFIYGVKPEDGKISAAVDGITNLNLGKNEVKVISKPTAPRYEICIKLTDQMESSPKDFIYYWNGTGWKNTDGKSDVHEKIEDFFTQFREDNELTDKLKNEMNLRSITRTNSASGIIYSDYFGDQIYINNDKWVTEENGTKEVWWCEPSKGIDDKNLGIKFTNDKGIIRHYQTFLCVKDKNKDPKDITMDDCDKKDVELCFKTNVNQKVDDLCYKHSNQTPKSLGSLIDPNISNFSNLTGYGIPSGKQNLEKILNVLKTLEVGPKGYTLNGIYAIITKMYKDLTFPINNTNKLISSLPPN